MNFFFFIFEYVYHPVSNKTFYIFHNFNISTFSRQFLFCLLFSFQRNPIHRNPCIAILTMFFPLLETFENSVSVMMFSCCSESRFCTNPYLNACSQLFVQKSNKSHSKSTPCSPNPGSLRLFFYLHD